MKTRLDRFLEKTKPGQGGCTLWTGCTDRGGYGTVGVGNKKIDKAHRVAWAFENGPIPHGMHVLHSCDVRNCVNTAHLSLGSNADNVVDRDRKGRQRTCRGSGHKLAKLTESDVREIRRLYLNGGGWTQRGLASHYGVSQRLVLNILKGRSWPHVEMQNG